MKNVIELMKARREAAKNNDGFSLLELVVAVGILLVLTVGGLLAYNGITDNARDAAVESAASEVYTAAVAFEASGKMTPEIAAQTAEKNWMDTRTGEDISVDATWAEDADTPTVTATHTSGNSATKPGTP